MGTVHTASRHIEDVDMKKPRWARLLRQFSELLNPSHFAVTGYIVNH
jgi:hypothetical protein